MPRRVLVVDDDPPIANVLGDLLCDEGYEVYVAYSGKVALCEAEHRQFDVVISDVMMPGMDGPTLVQRLHDLGQRAPVILMSAVYHDVDTPAVAFVRKPFDIERLVSLVARIVEQGADEHEGRARLLPVPDRAGVDNG